MSVKNMDSTAVKPIATLKTSSLLLRLRQIATAAMAKVVREGTSIVTSLPR